MNKYQEIANEAYGDAYEIELIVADPGAEVGDSLATLIANELGDFEGIDDAIQRMGTAIDELDGVHLALIKAKGEGVV